MEQSSQCPWITNIDYKKAASVPLVTITCSLGALVKNENMQSLPKNPAYEAIYERSIQVDITCNTVSAHEIMQGHRHQGIECVELVKQYVKECWLIEPLLLVLKQALKANGLNEPFKGGMSSYGLLLMIVGFLQHKRYDAPCDPKSLNLGEILLEFLSFFSVFDYKNLQIWCRKPDENVSYAREVIQAKQPGDHLVSKFPYAVGDSTIQIIDPLLPQSNVTKSTRLFT